MASQTPDIPSYDLTDRGTYATWTADSVRYADLDPNGHVNNGAVNQYFEDGRVHFRSERMKFLGDALFTGFAVGRFTVGDTVRDNQYRYTEYRSDRGAGELTGRMLYDHQSDPEENLNIAGRSDARKQVDLMAEHLNTRKAK